MIAAAMSTLYSFTPVEVATMLLSATVTGLLSPTVKALPNRKSFQMLVNCQMTVTTIVGTAIGSISLKKIGKKPAPSILAACTMPSDTDTKKLRKNSVVNASPYTVWTSTRPQVVPARPNRPSVRAIGRSTI